MQNPFRIDKSYRIRHKILKALFDDWNINGQVDRIVGSIRIATLANIPIADVHLWQGLLVQAGEVNSSDTDGQIMMSIQLGGRNACIQNKYLIEGRKEKWDGAWNWARIIIPLGTLILTIVNFISNRNLNERTNKLQQQINTIQSKIDTSKK